MSVKLDETALEAAFAAALRPAMRAALGPKPDQRFGPGEMLDLAESAVKRIDLWGVRGITGISTEQIAAMACVIAVTDGVGLLRARMAATVTETTKKETPDVV